MTGARGPRLWWRGVAGLVMGGLGSQTKKFGFYPESLERALWQQCEKMNQRLVRQEVGRGRGDPAGAGPGNVGAEP